MKNKQQTHVLVPLILDGDEISKQLTHEQALLFISDIDLGFQDAGFTEELIALLVKSLRVDYTEEEINDFIESLKV